MQPESVVKPLRTPELILCLQESCGQPRSAPWNGYQMRAKVEGGENERIPS